MPEYLYMCQNNLALDLPRTYYAACRRAYAFNNRSLSRGQNDVEPKCLTKKKKGGDGTHDGEYFILDMNLDK